MNEFTIFCSSKNEEKKKEQPNKKYRIKTEIRNINCDDFFDTFHRCCNDQQKGTGCNTSCNTQILFRTNKEKWEPNINLQGTNNDLTQSYQLDFDNLKNPLYIAISLFVQGRPALIDEWVLVNHMLSGYDHVFVKRGVHEKCYITVMVRLDCKEAVGVGCKQECSDSSQVKTCDPVTGIKICETLLGDNDCTEKFVASESYTSASLIIVSLIISIAVNSGVLGAFLLIRKYAKFKDLENLEKFAEKFLGGYDDEKDKDN